MTRTFSVLKTLTPGIMISAMKGIKTMTINVNVTEATAHFSELFQQVLLGEEVVISEGGNALARLIPALDPTRPRVPGQDKGKIFIAPDFDEPLPEETLRDFLESSIDPT